jgi:hypothetical protein
VVEFAFENMIADMKASTDTVHSIVEQIILEGAQVLYMRYIASQRIPYASRTLALELCLTASWTSITLDLSEPTAYPDTDLTLPPIDEWSGGVLPVRNAEQLPLRVSATPQRELRKTGLFRRTRPLADEEQDKPPARGAARPATAAPSASKAALKPRKAAPVITEAQVITKAFDEARKKTNSAMKAVTVDADFTVIQINEPKGLPPALIVPTVSTKGKAPVKPPASALGTPKVTRPTVAKTDAKKRRRPQTALVAPDMPVFDEEVANISYSDRFICEPGVTFKDGSVVKSRPPIVNPAQMTKAQYGVYLEEMKKSGEEPTKQ